LNPTGGNQWKFQIQPSVSGMSSAPTMTPWLWIN